MRVVLFLSMCVAPRAGFAGKRFSEIVVVFPDERKINFFEEKSDHSVTIEFKNTTPAELRAFYNYDDSCIRRLIIRDQGPEGTSVNLILRDAHLKASIDILKEPFRLSFSVFDPGYQQKTDPKSGLPLVGMGGKSGPVVARTEGLGMPAFRRGYDDSNFVKPLSSPDSSSGRAVEPASPTVRRLLQPTPELIKDSGELARLLKSVSDGRGAAWKEFPFYMYPTQTAAFEGREKPGGWSRSSTHKNPSDYQRMAEIAYKMYSFGNEKKALIAYQQVLHKEPSVFSKDVLHLWSFAESHLGQGNLSLADGYFDAIVRDFPESTLSGFAFIRKLDIQSVRYLRDKKPELLADLTRPLSELNVMNSGELAAQKAIRMAYWLPPLPPDYRKNLPLASQEIIRSLKAAYESIESNKTTFLAASIILKNFLHPSAPWTKEGGILASTYLSRYSEPERNPFYVTLKKELEKKLSGKLIEASAKEDYRTAVAIWEGLPDKIKNIQKNIAVAWAVAESFRNLNLSEKSLKFYKISADGSEAGPQKFKSGFWYSVLSGRVANAYRGQKNDKMFARLERQSLAADPVSFRNWKNLGPEEKNTLRSGYKRFFEETLNDDILLKTPARIMLESWQLALKGKKREGEDGSPQRGNWAGMYSRTSEMVYLLQRLIERFRKTGLSDERRAAARLLREIKPEGFLDDKNAQNIWTDELSALADEYRESNEYLRAGRLYTFTADNSLDWKNRAEALYKGGLLLYRAGKREEAIDALTKASQDGNNLFFANLAKERLTQLLP